MFYEEFFVLQWRTEKTKVVYESLDGINVAHIVLTK